ncbi:hypothetical protein EVAR_55852_1 [Eumeta japonica]|uniref:Uncharacterized protein n=1 Tax=Eumeta variegata TaxID=151549 RepID=A0A4C1ZC19_EUMVA|nr:hypothetical protein EVAR_55852_1 [Eumeta japonica]
MGERRKEAGIDQNTSMHIARPHRGELHVVDASEKSYAAAVYWRIKLSEHESAVSLIAGKARVAPLKVISIPRLELKAALLSAQLSLYERQLITMMPRRQRPYMSCAGRGRYRARYRGIERK